MCQMKATWSAFMCLSPRCYGGRVHLGRDPRSVDVSGRRMGTSLRKSQPHTEGEQGREPASGPMSGNLGFPLIKLMHVPDEGNVESFHGVQVNDRSVRLRFTRLRGGDDGSRTAWRSAAKSIRSSSCSITFSHT